MIQYVPDSRVILTRWVATPGGTASPQSLGAKGARLRDLAKIGIPVPAWIALTTDATHAVLRPLEEEIRSITDSVPRGDAPAARTASDRIERLVRSAPWPRALRDDLRDALRKLRSNAGLAVRSSAAWEDGTRSSHAGQLASVLYVASDGVESAVRTCWASAWTDRAILYRQARGLPAAGLAVAVIIQEMIESAASGVAFTADPLTGTPAELVVAGYGLGDGIVSDQVETDEFVRRPSSAEWRATVRRKTRRSIRRGDGVPGTELAPVPTEVQELPAITREQLDRLGDHLLRIDRAAGRAQDVEWSIDRNGTVFILQARPITSAPTGRLTLWDDGNIGESYPGITLPLTYSYVRMVYERVFTRALRQIGVSGTVTQRASTSLARLVGTIDGRLYLNVLELYRLYALVPGLEPAVRRWEDAFGVRAGDEALHRSRITPTVSRRDWIRPLGKSLARLRTRTMLALRFLTRSRDVRRLKHRMTEVLRRLENVPVADLAFEDLLESFENIQLRCLDPWSLVLFNDLYATYFSDRLARLCGGPATAAGNGASANLRDRLLRGETRMESVAPLRSVLALAREAGKHPVVASLLRSGRADREVWSEILSRPGAERFHVMAIVHIRDHGHRVTDELKLEASSLHEEPWRLVTILRNYLDLGLDPEAMVRHDREIRAAAEREFRFRFRRNPFRAWHALWILDGARRSVTDRENLALVRTRAHALLRRHFRAMGDSLAREGALGGASDIFYLTIEDLQAYARGGLPEGGLDGIVELRRARYAAYEHRELPHRILCRGPVHGKRAPVRSESPASTDSAKGILRGIPCSAGRVRGIARVIRSASACERVDGEILVAPVTDPGWMFLMLAAKGLIVERGSVLSHTAIIGREIGIPTIVGVEGAIERIKTGDEIELDGSTGEVWILDKSGMGQGF
jgi:rifampicin phosphotransferase